jgi:KaiC/GvpD/RAD55 family RecA-like ATPase
MLEGGLVAHRPYLVVGPSGTGKTTLALQFLCEGIRRGERALLVTLEEPPNETRLNHRGLSPELDSVDVFDAIPDIMRYERVPFKDIASVRYAAPFSAVPIGIRRSPELSAVEVTMAALEQMLRSEVIRKGYSRLAIDSLTALQYFCMKGFDAVAGAQTFLRFLSDLRVTTILTVESPLEDVETAERALARGEIRLFRWELDNLTVRAIGVEKFRGGPHDVRLHPYRIGPKGIDINLGVTISRDTRQIIEPLVPAVPVVAPTPIPLEEVISPVDPLAEEVRDLVLVGADVGPVRTEIEAALGAAEAGDLDRSRGHISRAAALAIGLTDSFRRSMSESKPHAPDIAEAYQRIVQRGEAARAGLPPTKLPPPKVLEVQLEWVLSLIPPAPAPSVPVALPTTEVPVEKGLPPPVVGTPILAAEETKTARIEPVTHPVAEPMPPPGLVPPIVETAPVEAVAAAPSTPSARAAPLPPPPPPEAPAAQPLQEPVPRPGPAVAPLAGETTVASVAPALPPLPLARPAKARAETGRPPAARSLPAPSRPSTHAPKVQARPPLPRPPTLVAPPVAPAPSREPSPPLPGIPRGRVAEAPRAPVPSPAPTALPVPSPAATAPSAAVSPTKRRRRPAATVRRKAPGTVVRATPAPSAPAPSTPVPAPGVGPSDTSPPAPAPVPPGLESAPLAKPKKRAARKRKAPTVVTATAGAIPTPAPGTAAPSSPTTKPADPSKEVP